MGGTGQILLHSMPTILLSETHCIQIQSQQDSEKPLNLLPLGFVSMNTKQFVVIWATLLDD